MITLKMYQKINNQMRELKIGLIGCGAIGSTIARAVDKDRRIYLEALYDIDFEKAVKLSKSLKFGPDVAKDFEEFLSYDWKLAVEAASQEAVKDYSSKILEKGDLMIMSVGALDSKLYKEIYQVAEKYGRRIYIPSGAIAGVDAVKAASLGRIYEVELVTTKNPRSLGLESKERKIVYKGNARNAAKLYPKNINVCMTLSLASIGANKVKVKIISDPSVESNTHEIYVKGEFGKLETKVENVPLPENPKTSHLAALSAIKTLQKIVEPVQIGT
jgi:aspartate dehydrogenase